MSSQNTKLELTILGAAFVVLLFCRQPPRSGNAGIARDAGPTPPASAQRLESPSPASAASDNVMEPFAVPTLPKKRLAMVDLSRCNGLSNKGILYGEVTAKRVWNGREYVWGVVCEVKEADGTTSVWSFSDRDDITVTEVPPEAQP